MVTIVTPVKVTIIKVIMVTNLGNFPKYHQFIFIINYENWCAAWLFLHLSFFSICNTLFSYFRLLLTASIFPCLSWSNTTSLLPFHFVSSRAEHFVISNSQLKIHMVDMMNFITTVVLNYIDVGSSQVTFSPANSRHFLEQHVDRNSPVWHMFLF